jgi:PhnB protein
MSKIRPYLGFNGQCKEAMTFYQNALGGDLNIMTVAQSGQGAQMPPEMHDKVMHSSLTKGTLELMASDMVSTDLNRGPSVSIMMECDSKEELQDAFAKLCDGGIVTQPLIDSFWGSTFGHLTDKYGINWMFNFEHPKG